MYSVSRHLRWQKKEENIKIEKSIFPKGHAYAIVDIFLISHIYVVYHLELKINRIKLMHINYLQGRGCDITGRKGMFKLFYSLYNKYYRVAQQFQ